MLTVYNFFVKFNGEEIDQVSYAFSDKTTKEHAESYVRRSLIKFDDYPSQITVERGQEL